MPKCGCVLSDLTGTYNRVSEDLIDFKWTNEVECHKKTLQKLRQAARPDLMACAQKSILGFSCHGPGGHNDA